LHLDRYRSLIEAEVDRRIDRAEPPPAAREEIVRRFRSFCRLASIDRGAAKPSLDGLGGNDPAGLERAVSIAVEVAIGCAAEPEIEQSLRDMELRFRAGLRRIMTPKEPRGTRQKRRRQPNAGKRVRSAIDRIGDAYVALCLDTGLVYDLNPAAETLLGIQAEQLLKKPLVELIPDDARPAYRNFEARLDAEEDTGLTSLAFNRGDGETVSTEVSVMNHTIAGKRLAILIARECEAVASASRGYSTRTTASRGIFSTRDTTARPR
jgi:PAS domain S-box-containing protein